LKLQSLIANLETLSLDFNSFTTSADFPCSPSIIMGDWCNESRNVVDRFAMVAMERLVAALSESFWLS
jgi:hypothetical protein